MPGHLARRFQQQAVAAFNAELTEIAGDLTPVQYSTLLAVMKRPGIDQATLASTIAHDRATITGVIDRLVKKGLLTRNISEADRRSRMLRITQEGAYLLAKVQPAVDRAQQQMVSKLSDDEQEQFITLLRKATALSSDDA
jgi:DNA-binding MarR family transcriptional regulator